MAKKIVSQNVTVCNSAPATTPTTPTPAKVLFAQAQAAAEQAARLQMAAERAREEEREVKARVRALQNATARQDADDENFFAPEPTVQASEKIDVTKIIIACALVAIAFLLLILACH